MFPGGLLYVPGDFLRSRALLLDGGADSRRYLRHVSDRVSDFPDGAWPSPVPRQYP